MKILHNGLDILEIERNYLKSIIIFLITSSNRIIYEVFLFVLTQSLRPLIEVFLWVTMFVEPLNSGYTLIRFIPDLFLYTQECIYPCRNGKRIPCIWVVVDPSDWLTNCHISDQSGRCFLSANIPSQKLHPWQLEVSYNYQVTCTRNLADHIKLKMREARRTN